MILPPPSTLGVLGGGQLGRMLALEARRAGHRIAIFTDEPQGCPAGQFADIEINAAYERMLKNDVKYRFVIDMASLKS